MDGQKCDRHSNVSENGLSIIMQTIVMLTIARTE